MNKRLIVIYNIILVLLLTSVSWGESTRSQVAQGNKLYREGKLDEALSKYREAQIDAPDVSETFFNMGNAYYKKKEYDKAIENFSHALATSDIKLESKANYNIGNCKYQLGESKSLSDINEAVARYRESLDYYKKAIELDSQNQDARYNHELVEIKLKELLSKQKEQQDKQKGENKDQKDQKKDKDKKEDQQSQKEEQKKKEEEQKKQAGQQDDKKDEDKKGEEQQAQKVNIPKEEAERLLRKLMNDQSMRRQNNQRPQGTSSNEVDKDW